MLRILLIDDNPDDRVLAIRELRQAFAELMVEQVAKPEGYEQALLVGNFDLVVTDYQLGWSDGIAVLRAIKARYPDIPVVMFTNSGNEEVAVEAMKAGLDDYVLKSPKHYFRLPIAVRSSLEQARQRGALKEVENRYSNLFNRVPVGLYRITPTGHFLDANPALVQLLGYSDRQALVAIKTIDFHMDAEVWRQWRERMERDEVVRDLETPVRALDGRRIWVRHDARAVRDGEGKVVYYEGAIEDVTSRKQAEEERIALLAREQAARAEAEAVNRMKDEFLATLSHELRTPLNAMVGWATVLRTRKMDEATTARALEVIERNARAQTQMIEDLLDVSRIIRSKLQLQVGPVDLVLVLEVALDAVRPAADAKAIQLAMVYEPSRVETQDQKVSVMGDSDRMQQVVWNLLSNTIKFTPSGGRVEVRLSVVSGESQKTSDGRPEVIKYAQIQVSDTGCGIDAEFLPYIFDRFRQADSTITRSHGGLGLGLSIVRHLVELHGGTVYAESPGVGQGATFTVQLPLLEEVTSDPVSRSQLHAVVSSVEQTGVEELEDSLTLTLKGLQVLVVDDEPDTREIVSLALEQYAVNVTTAASAFEALKVLEQLEPDVLISDIGMPGEDGYTLIRKVRQLGGQMPAVALTAYAREEDRASALAAGFQCHISKPVEPEQLVAMVAQLAEKIQII